MKRVYGLSAAIERFSQIRRPGAEGPKSDGNGLFDHALDPDEFAAHVIAEVRQHGADGLLRISERLDGIPLSFIEVPQKLVRSAPEGLSGESREALDLSIERVRSFQETALPAGWTHESGEYGEIVTPVRSAGAYVPAGTAPLASTVVMTVIPARVAGVREVVLCTPAPGNELPHRAVLAAAALSGVDRVFKIGGAQAIAALAYGAGIVPAVDVICGPGNVWVTAAKKAVYGDVGIDGLYGPTETLVVVDQNSDPELAAADLLAQAEHDVLAVPVLVCIGEDIAKRVEAELDRQLKGLDRSGIAAQAIRQNGMSAVLDTPDEAIEAANALAPEHLCLMIEAPHEWSGAVTAAGGIFMGENSGEIMGDYVAGPSHVMPTGGTARFASALSVRNFLRTTPFLNLSEESLLHTAPAAATLAGIEGLGGHKAAAQMRLKKLVGE